MPLIFIDFKTEFTNSQSKITDYLAVSDLLLSKLESMKFH